MIVLHLTTYLQGGAGRCIADLALTQQKHGMRPIVVTSASGHGSYQNYPEYLELLRGAGISVHLIHSLFDRDLTRNLSVVEALSRLLPDAARAIVHAHAATPARIGLLLAATALRRPPVVQTMHGWGAWKSREQAAADLAVMAQVDAVVTTSQTSSRQLAAMGLVVRRIEMIPCGLAPEPPAAADDGDNGDEVSTALRFARARGARIVLCVGSVNRNKNQKLLLEALTTVSRHQPVFCAFIGEGAGIAELSRHAQDLNLADTVRFFGHRPRAASYLPMADLLVLPSRSEGQGLVVLEAFRAGVPVVVSDAPALVELVSGPDLGVTFESNSADALAAAIRRVVGLPASRRESITASARKRFLLRYTTATMHTSHEALYRDVLADRKPPGAPVAECRAAAVGMVDESRNRSLQRDATGV